MYSRSSCNSDVIASRNRTHSASSTVSLKTLRYQYHPGFVGFSVVHLGSLIAVSLWVRPIDGR